MWHRTHPLLGLPALRLSSEAHPAWCGNGGVAECPGRQMDVEYVSCSCCLKHAILSTYID